MLTIPQQRDPIVRVVWIAIVASAVWINVAGYQPRAQAQDIIIINATATPALPSDAPAFALIAPTPQPWIDQALDQAAQAGNDFATDQADQLAQEQAAARDQYLANVGAQTPHSPRGDVPEPPPSYSTGPVALPVNADNEIIIIDPNPVIVAAPQYAAAVPAISADQAAIIGQRQSNGCPDGETFYPRSGCHAPGSGGAMPGAVGEATP